MKYPLKDIYGINRRIERFQYLFDKYFPSLSIYGQAQINERKGANVYEVYDGSEYYDVLTNDEKDGIIFFVITNRENNIYDLDICFSVNLKKLLNDETKREYFIEKCKMILKRSGYLIQMRNITDNINEVYSGAKLDEVRYNNMLPYLHFKISITLMIKDCIT